MPRFLGLCLRHLKTLKVWSWASSSQPWPVEPVLQRLDSLRGGCEMADLARLAWALAPAAPGALIGLQQEGLSGMISWIFDEFCMVLQLLALCL